MLNKIVPGLRDPATEFALYVHYPFCEKRCPYCGFATKVARTGEPEKYARALMHELESHGRNSPFAGAAVRSVYFGGGTPSLMPVELCCALLDAALRLFPPLTNPADLEITIEANPTSRDAGKFVELRRAGVNRISIGAQSFNPVELKFLGRWHSPADVADAVRMARRAGFDNVSVDLIYGLPGQASAQFIASVRAALDLGVDHLSAYSLSIEPGTPFARRVKSGAIPPPDPDAVADLYARLCEEMTTAGFVHYELTNWAHPGFESRHNLTYWLRIPYLGLGLGAHSFAPPRRFWNTRRMDLYLKAVLTRGSAEDGQETLTPLQTLEESVYLGLRTRRGIGRDLERSLNAPEVVDELTASGFLERFRSDGHDRVMPAPWAESSPDRLRMVEGHWLLLDAVVLRLMEKAHAPTYAHASLPPV